MSNWSGGRPSRSISLRPPTAPKPWMPWDLVDLVSSTARSGLRPRRIDAPVGPVLLSAVDPLIIRRLMRSSREG